MAELHYELAVMLVNTLADRAPERNFVVIVDHGIARQDPPAHRDWRVRGDDAADTPLCELLLPIKTRVSAMPIVVIEHAGEIRSEQAILYFELAKFQGREDQRGVVFM
jgi:hypothetical protein